MYKNDDIEMLLIWDYNKGGKKKIINKEAFRNIIDVLEWYAIYGNGYKCLVLSLVKDMAN